VKNGETPGTYLVECYWPAVSESQHAAAAGRARAAVGEARRAGHELEFLGSILIPAEETVFCLFAGSEADVRAVSREAGLPLERVLESVSAEFATSSGGNSNA
jgi:hypothetical protein